MTDDDGAVGSCCPRYAGAGPVALLPRAATGRPVLAGHGGAGVDVVLQQLLRQVRRQVPGG